MADFTNGTYKLIYIFLNGEYFPIGCLTSNSFSETSDMLDTTTRQNSNGWKTSIPTNQSYNISFSGLVTSSNKSNTIVSFGDIKKLKRDKTLVSWLINLEEGGLNEIGTGYIDSLSNDAEIDSFVSFTGQIVGYGQPVTASGEYSLNYTLNANI